MNRKDSHSLTGDYFPTSVLREAECNWGLASFKPWFGRSLAMCLRANRLISLNLFFGVFFFFSSAKWEGNDVIHKPCMQHALHCQKLCSQYLEAHRCVFGLPRVAQPRE